MTDIRRQNVIERCRSICVGFNENSVCRFVENSNLLGFIDTSQGQNGTRGIAFSEKNVFMNFDGETVEILYKKIKSVQIISSFEDFFADELLVVYSSEHPDLYSDANSDKEIRISDFSLDKSELKRLLDGFCTDEPENDKLSVSALEKNDDQSVSDAFFPNESKLPRGLNDLSQDLGDLLQAAKAQEPQTAPSEKENISESSLPEDPTDKVPVSEVKEPDSDIMSEPDIFDAEIPEIFRRRDDFVDIVFEDRAPVITETFLPQSTRSRVIETRDPTPIPQPAPQVRPMPQPAPPVRPMPQQPEPSNELYEDESAERVRIQNMSHEETLSFLSKSLNEINAPVREPVTSSPPLEKNTYPRQPEQNFYFRPTEIKAQENAPLDAIQTHSRAQVQPQIQAPDQEQFREIRTEQAPVREVKKPVPIVPQIPLTEEPIWGDIYIKASRNLRELCESGRLSMGQIEQELDSRLLDSAKAFAEIIADEAKVPKVLIPKITELKAASKNFDQYFQMGEDIAVRAMFFMMYQMLSYADRIVETPETKERLNDFFRRFGSAGITLSMLDMRV